MCPQTWWLMYDSNHYWPLTLIFRNSTASKGYWGHVRAKEAWLPSAGKPMWFLPVQQRRCPVLSCPVVCCPVVSCPVVCCPVVCAVLSCAVLWCPVVCCPVVSCPLLCAVLWCGVLSCAVLSWCFSARGTRSAACERVHGLNCACMCWIARACVELRVHGLNCACLRRTRETWAPAR